MKQILMFMMKTCPHCQRALAWMDELKRENPQYQTLEITMVDEQRESALANQYDYYYVPTYYVGGIKVHEGAASKAIVRSVFDKALE